MSTLEEIRKTIPGLSVVEVPTVYLEPEVPAPVEKPKKKKKLTKAEKKARKLKAAMDQKKAEMRFYLRQELELSKKSAERGWADWEEMCKEIKLTELRDELETWAVKSRQLMEAKDEQITAMLADMDTIQEMHKRSFETHVQMMDYITDVHNCFLETTEQLYEAKCTEAIQDFYEEMRERTDAFADQKLQRENIMHASNLIFERTLANDLKIYKARQDDVVNTEIANRYRIRDEALDEMKKLRKQLLSFISKARDNELDPHKHERIRMLMERQRTFVSETQRLNNVESVLSRQRIDVQRDLLRKEIDGQNKTHDLKLERAYYYRLREEIERKIQEENDDMTESLIELTTESNKIIEKYQKWEKHGEHILTLAASCRKLMTEKEKVVPWDDYSEGENFEETEFVKEHFKVQTLDLGKHLDLDGEKLAKQANLMRNFWRRVAHVEMHNMFLEAEKARLTAENDRYCQRIRDMGNQATDNVGELLATITYTPVFPEERPCEKLLQKKRRSSQSSRASERTSQKSATLPSRGSARSSQRSTTARWRSSKQLSITQ